MTEPGGIVTILFTDIVGSTDALSQTGDVLANELRQRHFELLRGAIAEHRGAEVKNLGDGLMVVFGSALDAVDAAVGMQQAVAGTNVQLRVGLNVGEPFREADDYFGSPVVVASRLCDAATGGQILASDVVRALVASRGTATFHDAGYLALKGIPDPVAAWEVGWEPPVTASRLPLPPALDTGQRVPFVGRHAEQDVLIRDWKAAKDGRRTVSLLAGEPGIGKTRLASQLAAHAHEQGATVLFGRADEESLVPYQPFVEAIDHIVRETPPDELRALIGDAAPDLARLIPHLHERLPGTPEAMRSEPETERYRVFEAVRALFAALTEAAPVVLVLDDLHWADKPTLLLLHHLLRPGTEMALHIVGTYRDTDLDRRHPLADTLADLRRQTGYERIALSGLVEGDIKEFLDLITGQDPPVGFARLLREQTEGNPFFIGEVLRHLVESGAVAVVDGQWQAEGGGAAASLPIPEGVKEVIGRRLTRLSDEANHVLSVGAVLGRDFDLDVLTSVADVDDDAALTALEAAVTARLVVERPERLGRYHFVHALVRETLYEELTSARRARLHRRAAIAFEEQHRDNVEPVLAQLAYHYAEAAQAGDVDKAVDYALRAGRAALDLVAYEEAAAHFERALHVLELADEPDATERAEILLALGDARDRSGDREAARTAYGSVLDLARRSGNGDQFGRAALGWIGMWEPGAVRPDVIALLEDAVDRLPEDDSATRARVLVKLAMESYFGVDPDRVRQLHESGLAMARRVGDPGALSFALMFFPNYFPLGNTEAWAERAAEGIALGTAANDAVAIQNCRMPLMINLVELGDMAQYDEELAAAEELADRVRVASYSWYVPLWHATRAIMRGEISRGEELAVRALTLGQEADDPGALQMFGVQVFALRREQGRIAEVEGGVRAMVTDYPLVPAWHVAVAGVLAETGRFEEAREELEVVLGPGVENFPADGNWGISLALLADVWDQLGEPDPRQQDAYDLLLPFQHRFVTVGWAADAFGSVHRPLGVLAALLGRHDAADAHFTAAIAADLAIDGVRAALRGKWQLAKMLLRRDGPGDRARADALIDDGLAGCGELVRLSECFAALRK